VIQGCADAGLLLISCGVEHNVIRWIPPLNVKPEEIDRGARRLRPGAPGAARALRTGRGLTG